MNTDLAELNHSSVESKILIGQDLTNGYGAGADPAVGLKAAQESEEAFKAAIEGSDTVIITAGDIELLEYSSLMDLVIASSYSNLGVNVISVEGENFTVKVNGNTPG